jgi:hypothetical protein
MGALAEAVFARICGEAGDARGLFTADALKAYGAQLGREVAAPEVQGALGALMGANLLMRIKHGHYGVTDPLVEAAWRERQRSLSLMQSTPRR